MCAIYAGTGQAVHINIMHAALHSLFIRHMNAVPMFMS